MNRCITLTGLRWIWLSIVILIIDLSSKYIILSYFNLFDTVQVFPFLNLYYVRNYGVAFRLFEYNSIYRQWLLVFISISICVIILFLMFHSNNVQRLKNISYALIIGGALGNLFDRILHGFVIDMVDFYIKNWHFATFNIADSAICIGTILLLLDSLYFDI